MLSANIKNRHQWNHLIKGSDMHTMPSIQSLPDARADQNP
jgi:hypothetical protein